MDTPEDFKSKPSKKRLARLRLLSGLVLMAEQSALHLWRLLTWIALIGGLWLFEIPALFGTAGEVAIFALFVAGCGWFAVKDVRHIRWPARKAVDRRIEKDSGARHRPLSALEDRLANPEKQATRKLWTDSREKILAALANLRPARLRAFMPERDPYALRIGALLFLGAGLVTAGADWRTHLLDGLAPFHFGDSAADGTAIRLWITPPDYTRREQVVLQAPAKGIPEAPVEIPAGSTLKLFIHDGFGKPVLHIGDKKHPFTKGADGSYTLETVIAQPDQDHAQTGKLTLRQGFFTRAHWPYRLVPDEPPRIKLKGTIEAGEKGSLRIPLSLYDDYGVQSLTLHMRIDPALAENAPQGKAVSEKRAVISPPGVDFEIAPTYDLTAHPWAGHPVIFEISAVDHLGQSAALPPLHTTLPERPFSHPVARRLIAVRRSLIEHPEAPYTEELETLFALLAFPEAFQHDLTAYLNIRAAAARMAYNEPSARISSGLMSLLWDTALRIDDGNLTLAAQTFQEAQRALQEALNNPDSTDSEKARLMHELRQALRAYMMALQENLQKRMADGQAPLQIPPDMMGNIIPPEALLELFDMLESQMLAGDTQAAQESLSRIARMMEMLGTSADGGTLPQDMQMMAEGINELQALIERQEALTNQTKEQASIVKKLESLGLRLDDSAQGRMPFVNTAPHKAEQEALRLILGRLMLEAGEKLDEVPENMGLAEYEMRGASEALEDNRPGKAVPHQEKALEHLKESQESLSLRFMARMQQMTGMIFGAGPIRYDPLGRPYGGDGHPSGEAHGSSVKVPDEMERKRVRETLELLRRRAGELNRPDVELEYYRRLLKRF